MSSNNLRCVSLFYHQRTHYILNYVTLQINDQEIATNLDQFQSENFDRLYWPMLILTTFVLLWELFGCFVIKTEPITSLSMAVLNFINSVFVWGLIRKFNKRQAPKFVYLFFLLHMIMLNLVYRDQVPDFAKTNDKSQYDYNTLILFFFACALNYNSLKFTILILFPTYLAGAYSQQLIMTQIYAEETGFYPAGYAR